MRTLRKKVHDAVADELGARTDELGAFTWATPDITDFTECSNVLPIDAQVRGYQFVEFEADRGDPWVLLDPDGKALKIWWDKPPSITEVRELTMGVVLWH